MDQALSPATGRAARQVYCLCAEWCGVCRQWRAAFEAQAAAHPGDRFAWVDIDAHEEVLDTVDIETFPVVLIAQHGQVLFFGAIEPSGALLARLLDRVEPHAAPAPGPAQQLLDFLTSLP